MQLSYSSFPLFTATSSVACFSCSFFLSSGDFICSLIFSLFLLSSSILSHLLLSIELRNNFFKSFWPLDPSPCPATTPFFFPPHLPRFSVRQSILYFFSPLPQCDVCCHCLRCCLLQMIQASTLPVWIMHRDYIKISWSNWSIFNRSRLLVKPAFLWSRHVCFVCMCLLKWTWVRSQIQKEHRRKSKFLSWICQLNSIQKLFIGMSFNKALQYSLKTVIMAIMIRKENA